MPLCLAKKSDRPMRRIEVQKVFPRGALVKPIEEGSHTMTVMGHNGEKLICAYNTPEGVRVQEKWHYTQVRIVMLGA